MHTFFQRLGAFRPQFLSILRIVTALLYLEHATMKLFAFPPSQMPSPGLFSLFGAIGVLELVGSLALLFCFVFLYIAAAGPGPWSLDARRGKI